MEEEKYEDEKVNFLKNYKKLRNSERMQFERNTVLQAGSSLWLEERRKLLTASNFHAVCRRRATTSCVNLVRNILYFKEILNAPPLNHGKKYEDIAHKQLAKQLQCEISTCGMFLNETHPFLGASPDGIIDEELKLSALFPHSMFLLSKQYQDVNILE